MSGIVGIVNLDHQPVDAKLLKVMTDSMSFRGPDGISIYTRQNVGLGHALLNTTSNYVQPQIRSLDERLFVTAHARIDDHHTLIKKLSRFFPGLNNSQVLPNNPGFNAHLILMAYQAWAEDCVHHLIGDFSFAIWDVERRRLFCARDQMGVGQFYYALRGRTFVFSNTLNCVRLHPAVSSKLNDIAIGDFLLFGVNQDPATTSFAEVHCLPRAHTLILTENGVRNNEYWKPTVRSVRFKTDQEYVDSFKELLEVAVSDRLASTDVGVAMSGGLDSSMVAANAAAVLKRASTPNPLTAYTVVYDSAFKDDERHFAGEVAKWLNIRIEFLEGASINQESSLRTRGFAPEPFDVDPFYVVSDELLRCLSTVSRVAITGWDGDAFMMESPKYLFKTLWRTRRFTDLTNELLRYVRFQRRPPPLGVRTWLRRQYDRDLAFAYPVWIEDSFERKLKLRDRWVQKTAEAPLLNATRPYAFRILNSPDWHALFSRYDPGSSFLPLEVRHPLIDMRLVEYLLALPVTPWLIGKHILREAARGVLPESVRRRKKSPLNDDPGLQLRYSTKVRDIDGFLSTPEVLNYIKRDAVPQLSRESDSYRLWVNARPFSLNEWFRNSFELDHMPSSEHPDERQSEYSRTPTPRTTTAVYDAHVDQLRSYP